MTETNFSHSRNVLSSLVAAALFVGTLMPAACAEAPGPVSADKPSKTPTPLTLLRTWCDGLLAHQLTEGPDAGGIFCPSHKMVHGRCGDAVYPLLSLFKRTGEEKYRTAARAVYAWSERRVSQPDGSWTNEAGGKNDWKGITCFSLLSLGETLRLHGDTLTADERVAWRARLARGADFVHGFQTFEMGDINYPFSAAAALALAGTLLDEPRHLARARELAAFSLRHFTANHLIWGEGQRGPNDLSPRGLRPIDIPYNVEESIPNLALYAELTHDDTVLAAAVTSLRAHLPWMLPDGGWDAGWCTRLAKWTYWGSRTSDGSAHGFTLLQKHDPRFAEAALRNLRLMAAHTHDGLLHGGPHLRSRGLPICTHPTFTHAKGLAIALDAGLPETAPAHPGLPADNATGLRHWPEAGVTQIALGPWRASLTVKDIPSTPKRGGHPSGGSPSMLWHENTGPLLVASMNDYVRYEGSNMDEAPAAHDRAVLTPRIEARRSDRMYSNLYDGHATLVTVRTAPDVLELRARGTLRDASGKALPGEDAAFEITYRFTPDSFQISTTCAAPALLIVPVVSPAGESITTLSQTEFTLQKPGVRVSLSCSTVPDSTAPADTPRIFNFVPGIQALPVILRLAPATPATVNLTVSP